MDTGRVGNCHRLENKRRQFLIVVNDVIRKKYDVYNEFLTREKEVVGHDFDKSKQFARRALVRQRVLQQCMQTRKDSVERARSRQLYGKYGGTTIDAFGREIETFIAHNHPKLRRKRHIQKLMDHGKVKGELLSEKLVYDRMRSFFQRSLTRVQLKKQTEEKQRLARLKEKEPDVKPRLRNIHPGLRPLPVIRNPFYTAIKENDKDDNGDETDANLHALTANMSKLQSNYSNGRERSGVNKKSKQTGTDPKHRHTLVLPPIKSTKALVQN